MTIGAEQRTFACGQCGASLTWDPGAAALKCPYCGFVNERPAATAAVLEQDFHAALALGRDTPQTETLETVKCPACAAEFTLQGMEQARLCPFCGTPIVVETHREAHIRPGAVLPFGITRADATERYRRWLAGRWFAPGRLARDARTENALAGMYVPYWTFDSATTTDYTGERGEDYFTSESYTATENGKSVTRTRQVRRTRWHNASGRIARAFDDVLVLASKSLPQRCAERLAPWDLDKLVAYDAGYLSGFSSEAYQVDVAAGFEAAKTQMEPAIRTDIQRDIGGDHQRIHRVDTRYDAITYKHLLLPVWLAAYRFDGKPFRFVINGRTGEVQGERPWSWAKIGAAVLVVLIIVALVIWLSLRS